MRDINMSEIEIMTHEQAVRSHAVERYLLGELSESEQSAFEAHCFDCELCFEQIELSQDFMRQARQVLVGEPQARPEAISTPEIERSWLATVLGDFRRPAMAFVSAMLLCAIGIGVYQHNEISSLKGPRVEARYMLRGESKGAEQVIAVARNSMLSLRMDYLRDAKYVSYQAQIVSDGGKVMSMIPLPATLTEDSVAITLPADSLRAGSYKVVIYGGTSDGQKVEVGHGSFELQFTN